jgi:hypothetical protein
VILLPGSVRTNARGAGSVGTDGSTAWDGGLRHLFLFQPGSLAEGLPVVLLPIGPSALAGYRSARSATWILFHLPSEEAIRLHASTRSMMASTLKVSDSLLIVPYLRGREVAEGGRSLPPAGHLQPKVTLGVSASERTRRQLLTIMPLGARFCRRPTVCRNIS